jgi:uncharacterized membrane protein YidH (DUF202 family)
VAQGPVAVVDESNASNGHWFARLIGVKAKRDIEGNLLKIQKKAFFANERTFINWLNAALLVASIGVALATTDNSSSGRLVGGLMVSVGVLVVSYGAFAFARRNESLLSQEGISTQQEYGPVALTGALIVVFFTAYFVG